MHRLQTKGGNGIIHLDGSKLTFSPQLYLPIQNTVEDLLVTPSTQIIFPFLSGLFSCVVSIEGKAQAGSVGTPLGLDAHTCDGQHVHA